MANNKKRRGRGSPRRNDTFKKDRRYEERPVEDKMDAKNDISWYSKYPNLLLAAGSFPYPNRPGMQVTLGNLPVTGSSQHARDLRTYYVPGIMTLDWAPSVGYSNAATDPASIMAKEFYAKVRAKYSGSLDADAPDFVIYIMALDSIFSYLAWLKRLYRVMNAWTPENYILPDVVLTNMGLSTADIINLRQNRMQLWQVINELVLQSRKFTCPAVMDVMNRHYWMSDNVYTDDPSINSQFYMFNLKAVYKFAMLNMPDGNPGPGLQMTPMPTVSTANNVTLTPEIFYNFGRSLIDALVAWDDAYTINGYLMRAFEGVSNFVVDELPADQPFNPMYEPEVLAQIENSRALPYGQTITDFSGFNVTQSVDTNALICTPQYSYSGTDPQFQVKSGGIYLNPVISVRSTTPTVADSVIASRLNAAVQLDASSTSGKSVFNVVAATEIPIGWRIQSQTLSTRSYVWINAEVHQALALNAVSSQTVAGIKASLQAAANLLRMEAFDWHPFVLVSYMTGDEGQEWVDATYVAGDVHNFTTIQLSDLVNLHKICVYSELNAFSI